MNPVDFAHKNAGRFLTSSSDPLAWTVCYGTTNKSGKRARFGPGTAVLIRDGVTVFAGMTPELIDPDAPVSVTPLTAADLKWQTLFAPPEGPWVGLSFGKTGVDPSSLVLNLSPNETVFVEDSGKTVTRVRVKALEEVAGLVSGRSEAELRRGMYLWCDKRAGVPMSNKAFEDYKKIVEGSFLPRAFDVLVRNEQSLGMLFKFMKFREAK